MKSKLLCFTVVLLALCMMTGCFIKHKNRNAMDRIKGDIECEFRVGKDAKTRMDAIETDVVFDKDKFVDLFNEQAQYSPTSLKYQLNEYGCFTVERAYSYDGKYFTKISESGDSVMITINDKNNELVDMIIPCRKSDFWGVCWENDNYNLWIQSGDVGVVCYSLKGGDWVLNSDAVRPDYIVSKYDK